jgi:serine/threonine protein kinase
MSIWSGKSLGRVQIGELIARGGMAEVYEGEHIALNRKVAVKIMRDHVDGDPDTRARFEREARVVASLNHPNIIQIFDYELADGRPCITMELVEGASLGVYLKSLKQRGETLPFDMVARILTAIASALDYAHSQNIVHRDIKPANVLLRTQQGTIDPHRPLPDDVEAILTDFGLVRLLDSSIQTSTGTVSGTPAYMSPEQARGDKVDHRSDIYSLGIILYEMLAGTVPFEAESSFGVLMKHINEPPPPIAGISPDLQKVINRALAKDPALRYDAAGHLVEEFTAVFTGETVSVDTARMSALAEQSARPKQIRPLAAGLAGAGILAVIALLAFFIFRPSISTPVNVNQPVGTLSFSDFNWVMDRMTLTASGLPVPKAGMHYEVWLLAQGGEVRRNAGILRMDDNGIGQLVFSDPAQENILEMFAQIEVTVEADGNSIPSSPTGEVAASSIFPPLALIHVRHVLVSFHDAPQEEALIQGLWYAAEHIDYAIDEMEDAVDARDEGLFRKKNEEIINQLVGRGNPELYRDWDEDGVIDDPGDGFGMLENGTGLGYIPATISHAFFAADAPDATDNIKLHSAHVIACVENMQAWSEQLLEIALQLQGMPFNADMTPLIFEMRLLSERVLFGVDADGNELIEPIPGEGGGDTAYEHAYYMADMPLLIGINRIPQPAQAP